MVNEFLPVNLDDKFEDMSSPVLLILLATVTVEVFKYWIASKENLSKSKHKENLQKRA